MTQRRITKAKPLLAATLLAGVGISGAGLGLSLVIEDPWQVLLSTPEAPHYMASLLAAAVLSWGVRRLVQTRLPHAQEPGRWAVGWVLSRLAFLLSVLALGLGFLMALLFGFSFSQTLLKALLLVLVASAFIGIVGTIFINLRLTLTARRETS